MSLCPSLVTGGTRALGKVLFLDCQLEWNVLEETPQACVPLLLPSFPLCPGHIPAPAAPLCGGAFTIGGVTLRKEAEGGNPITWRHAAQGAFHSSSSPEAPRPLGAVGIVSLCLLQRNCQDLEAVGRCGGEDAPVHGTGFIDWHILPASLSPKTVHPRHSACLSFRDVAAAQVTKPEGNSVSILSL